MKVTDQRKCGKEKLIDLLHSFYFMESKYELIS